MNCVWFVAAALLLCGRPVDALRAMDPYDEDMVDLVQKQVLVEDEKAEQEVSARAAHRARTIAQEVEDEVGAEEDDDDEEDEQQPRQQKTVNQVFVQLSSARKLPASTSPLGSAPRSSGWLAGHDQAAAKTPLAANISLADSMPKVAAWLPARRQPAGQTSEAAEGEPELEAWTDGLVPQAEDDLDGWTDDDPTPQAPNTSLLQSAPGAVTRLPGGPRPIGEPEVEAGGFTLQMDRRAWLLVTVGIELGAVFVTMGLAFLIWVVAAVIGRSIRFGIETCDSSILGTQVAIRRLETNIFKGTIVVDTLEVHNPQTNKYDSPYLLKAGLVQMDIDVAVLICSFFRHVKIDRLDFKNVDVIYEKGWDYSNVQDTLRCLKEKGDAMAEGLEAERGGVQVTLREVVVEDICARYQAQMFSGLGTRMAVGDVVYKDFQAEMGASTMGTIIQVLLQAVLKAVIANVAGKQHLVANCM